VITTIPNLVYQVRNNVFYFLKIGLLRRDAQLYTRIILTLFMIPVCTSRGGVRSTWGLGPTMTSRGQSIGISIGMLPQTLIMSRLDQLSRLGAGILFFH
jgi:hypothetical protein